MEGCGRREFSRRLRSGDVLIKHENVKEASRDIGIPNHLALPLVF